MKKIMKLNRKKVYNALSDAERDFKLPPKRSLKNTSGLCWYLQQNFGFSDDEVDYILEKRNSTTIFIFCNGSRQVSIYEGRRAHFYNERSDWCAKRKLDFKLN